MRKSLSILILLSTVTACRGENPGSDFIDACVGSQGEFTEEVCGCIYERLHEDFSPEQMTRISGLFKGDVSDASENLEETGRASDMDILERMNLIEETVGACFEG
ncbi:hypothetical protein [Rhodovulum marinum]|uniref:hypothetical protein n=1 Tax=Rhodovulum marinum TaxID=320662 RepID=UPI00104DAFFD|nr:hypothetical protein [Rhodovulum marinum]